MLTGVDISRAKKEDAGAILADKVRSILSDIGIPNGLKDMGYNTDDIPTMVAGAMPQVNIIITCPLPSVCLSHCKALYNFSFVWFDSLRCDMYTYRR